MNEELCSNCNVVIGVDQQAFICNGDIVCEQCHQKLTAPKPTAPPPVPVQVTPPVEVPKAEPKETPKVQPPPQIMPQVQVPKPEPKIPTPQTPMPAATAKPVTAPTPVQAPRPQVRQAVPPPQALVRPKTLEKKLSKMLYLYSLVGGLVLTAAFICLGAFLGATPVRPSAMQLSFYIVGVILLVYCIYVTLLFYYKIFKAIADSKKATSPAKAIGFLFIPGFNVYWIFYVLVGFAEDYNSYIARYAINAKKLSPNLFFVHAFSVLFTCFLAIIPVMVVLALLAGMGSYKEIAVAAAVMTAVVGALTFGLHAFVVNKLCDAVNALIEEPILS